MVKAQKMFREGLYEEWRHELELKLRSKALANIMEVAADKKSQSNFSANKYLLEKEFVNSGKKDSKTSSVGRPTKDAIRREAEALFNKNTDISEDYKRIQGLN
jgi:hypothetical protein